MTTRKKALKLRDLPALLASSRTPVSLRRDPFYEEWLDEQREKQQ